MTLITETQALLDRVTALEASLADADAKIAALATGGPLPVSTAAVPPHWQMATRVLVPVNNPCQHQVIFLNTYTGAFSIQNVMYPMPPPNIWQEIDLHRFGVSDEAVAVDIRGFLIITDGTNSKITDLAVAFKAVSSKLVVGNYADQTIAIGATGGSRTHGTAMVPVEKGIIHWAWLRGDVGEWPGGPIAAYPQGGSYGLNLSISAIYLP